MNPKKDILKWSLVFLLIAVAIGADFYFQSQPIYYRLIGGLTFSIIVLLVATRTSLGKRGWKFFKEAYIELRKVAWPSRQETVRTTLVVIVVVVIFALIIWVIDAGLMWAINFLTGQ